MSGPRCNDCIVHAWSEGDCIECPTGDGIEEDSFNSGFNYVDVIGAGNEGTLNLFHGDAIICWVRVVATANEIRKTAPERRLADEKVDS